jgi:hypothetical protein
MGFFVFLVRTWIFDKPKVITICDILFRIPDFLMLCALRYAPCKKLVTIER